MYLQNFNFFCGINNESNHIPGEEGALACGHEYMYVRMYVYMSVLCMYVCMHILKYVCHSISANRLYCKMNGDRIKLPTVKYI
jgi:hypothetical protein